MECGAEFSADRRYRYRLTRRIDGGKGTVMFVMLNPSKANEVDDDPTIRRCIGFANRWGYGMLYVVNLSPLMATYPADLAAGLPEPQAVRMRNQETILETATKSKVVVAAYGNEARMFHRSDGEAYRVPRILEALTGRGHALRCLTINKTGHPRHPLMVRGDTSLRPFPAPDGIT